MAKKRDLADDLTPEQDVPAEPKPRGPVVRHFIECKYSANGAVHCDFQTKRHPLMRSAEIEFQKHALTHATTKTVHVVRELKEVEAK